MNKLLLLGRTSLLLFLLAQAFSGHAQSLPNFGFETTTCQVNQSTANITNCLPGWSASHGTPHLDNFITNNNTNSVHLMLQNYPSPNPVSDGIFASCSFPVGNVPYTLTFRALTMGDFANSYALNVALTTGLVAGTYPNGPQTPPAVATAWAANANLTTDENQWYTYSIDVIPPTAGTYQLWLQPQLRVIRPNEAVWVFLDDVLLSGCLRSNLVFQNTTAMPADIRTEGTISAGAGITPPPAAQGPAIVQSGQTVGLYAHGTIALESGFSVEPGGLFEAINIGLGCAFPRPAPQPHTSGGVALAAQHNERTPLHASPNPADDYLQLPPGVKAATLYNAAGALVRPWAESKQQRIDVRSLPEGLYYLRMSNGHTTRSQRILIKH